MATLKRTRRRLEAELERFLVDTMKTSGSERTRMAAAMRLADILDRREQRETKAARSVSRQAESGSVPVTDGDAAPEEPAIIETEEETADRLLMEKSRRFMDQIGMKAGEHGRRAF